MSNSNRPAFPRPHSEISNGEREWAQEGMTLREYYAGLAMQGFISSPKYNDTAYAIVADVSVRFADALLTALEVPQ